MTPERLAEIKKIQACIPFIDNGTGVAETMEAMREIITAYEQAAARIRDLEAQLAEARREAADDDWYRDRASSLLTGVANALKGEPAPLHMHDHSDLPEVAKALSERCRVAEEEADAARNCIGPDPIYGWDEPRHLNDDEPGWKEYAVARRARDEAQKGTP